MTQAGQYPPIVEISAGYGDKWGSKKYHEFNPSGGLAFYVQGCIQGREGETSYWTHTHQMSHEAAQTAIAELLTFLASKMPKYDPVITFGDKVVVTRTYHDIALVNDSDMSYVRMRIHMQQVEPTASVAYRIIHDWK